MHVSPTTPPMLRPRLNSLRFLTIAPAACVMHWKPTTEPYKHTVEPSSPSIGHFPPPLLLCSPLVSSIRCFIANNSVCWFDPIERLKIPHIRIPLPHTNTNTYTYILYSIRFTPSIVQFIFYKLRLNKGQIRVY